MHVAFRPRAAACTRCRRCAETRFPLGTFRVWTVWRPAAQVLVYPAPRGARRRCPRRTARRRRQRQRACSQRASSTACAPTGPAIRSSWWCGRRPRRPASWSAATPAGAAPGALAGLRPDGLADREARLSRLAAWVLQADRLGLDYGLRLPGSRSHRRRRGAQAPLPGGAGAVLTPGRLAAAAARRARHAVPAGGDRLDRAAPRRPPAAGGARCWRRVLLVWRGTLAVHGWPLPSAPGWWCLLAHGLGAPGHPRTLLGATPA